MCTKRLAWGLLCHMVEAYRHQQTLGDDMLLLTEPTHKQWRVLRLDLPPRCDLSLSPVLAVSWVPTTSPPPAVPFVLKLP